MGLFRPMSEEERLRKIRERAEKNSQETIRKAEKAKMMREQTGAGPNYKGPRCPKCRSIYYRVLGSTSKELSPGKAVVGGFVAGAPGMFVGAAMGRKGKYQVVCENCGKMYEFKFK